jgi:hypothetical protein
MKVYATALLAGIISALSEPFPVQGDFMPVGTQVLHFRWNCGPVRAVRVREATHALSKFHLPDKKCSA